MNNNLLTKEERAAITGDGYAFGEPCALRLDEAKRALAPRAIPRRCNGSGWIHYFDDDHPCSGCIRCLGGESGRGRRTEAETALAWSAGYLVWTLAQSVNHAQVDRSLAGFRCLATIGAAFAGLAEVGKVVSSFLHAVVEGYEEVAVGRCYEVVGKRGKAKEHHGLVGECRWVGVRGGRDFYGNRGWHAHVGGTTSVGLKVPGQDKLVYVAAGQVARVPATAEAKEAVEAKLERAERKYVVVEKGRRAHVWYGANKGQSGVVFWVGSGKAGVRYGLDTNPNRPAKTPRGYRAEERHTLWVDAVDCMPYAFGSEEHTAAECAAALAPAASGG